MIEASSSVRSRLSGMSLFAFSLLPLMIGGAPALAAQAGVSLPTGGVVRAGKASFSAPGGASLMITQGSAKAIVDWASFSIGQGGTVRFDNGSGATLNRVTGAGVSSIDGLLSASGGVYLLNPNGVVIGKTGVVDVGGRFVASTLNLGDDAFLAGGELTFTGPSNASVINLGKVGALGGDVVLIASRVSNAGAITAAQGDVGLLAGTQVLVRDQAVDGGKFAVQLGGSGTSIANSGAITAAMAELRANGGDVYALAGDTAGVIRATGVNASDGRVFLTGGDAGSVTLGGTIAARGANGVGGAIETSAGKVTIGSAHIDAGPGGSWLLDPDDLTIDQTAANTIASTLNAGTSVTQQTTAAGTGGSGDISVEPSVQVIWSTDASLTLSAYRNIALGAGSNFFSSGAAAITLYADNTGLGVGTVSFGPGAHLTGRGGVTIYYNPASNPAGSTINSGSYATETDFSSLVGVPFYGTMLVNTVYDLQNMQNNLSARYALGRDIDAGATVSWNGGEGFAPLGPSTTNPFSGDLEGQGHTISGLTINRETDVVGLVGTLATGSTIDGLVLSGADVSGRFYVGALVGDNYGTVSNIRASGSVSGAGGVGGMVGVNDGGGVISNVASSVSVTGTHDDVGGVAGVSFDQIFQASSTGSVSGADNTGGIVGLLFGSIAGTMASGPVSGNDEVGGLVGMGEGVPYGSPGGSYVLASYATGAVRGMSDVGGLVGFSLSHISGAYATGALSGTQNVGGIAGSGGGSGGPSGTPILNVFWDEATTGSSSAFGRYIGGLGYTFFEPIGGTTGLSVYAAATYSQFDFSSTGAWVIFEGQTRPMLKFEASSTITNAHQLQLMDLNRAGTYTLANDIDLSVTSNPSDVWNLATGFVPIAAGPTNSSPFVGSVDGQGHTITNLTITASYAGTGLFGVIGPSGRVSNLNLEGATVNGGYYAGVLAGDNYGLVANIRAAGVVTGFGGVGGLIGVGELNSSVTNASSNVAVTATDQDVGGLLGVSLGAITYASASGAVTSPYAVGGLVGLNNGPISQSYATGAVLASGTRPDGGGLVGQNSFAGVVSDTYATGSVSGQNTIGGLIGYDSGTVTRGYATGLLTGAPEGGQYNIGGVLGGQYGGANASFDYPSNLDWDVATTGATYPVAFISQNTNLRPFTAIGGSTGKDPTQASSYPGFNFTTVWTIVPGVSRPTLIANPPPQ